MKAAAELVVESGQRMRWRSAPALVPRRTGVDRAHLVQAAGGPLGGDELELRIRLAEGSRLTVASAAATVAQPGRPGARPARWTVTAELAEGARLCWWPEPTVVCDGAELHAVLRLTLAEGAGALVREEVRLGRHGQRGGRYRGSLAVEHAGAPLVVHTTVLDGADPALTGPAGTAGQSRVTTLLGAGAEPPPLGATTGERAGARWARHDLAGPGWLLVAVGRLEPRALFAEPSPPSSPVWEADPRRHQDERREFCDLTTELS
jgi:urease accessory protein